MRDGILKIVAVLTLGSLAGNVCFYRELKAERRHLAEALAAADAVNHAKQFADEKHVSNGERPAGQSVDRSAKPTVSATPETSDQVSRQPKTIEECMREALKAQAESLRDPAQREERKNGLIHAQKLVSMFGNGEDGKAFGLNPEQMERLYEIEAEQQIQAMEKGMPMGNAIALSVARGNGPTQNPVIAAEFGNEVAQKVADYRWNAVGRQMTYGLVSVLTDADAPLSAAQRQRLTETYTKLYADMAAAERGMQVRNSRPLTSDELANLEEQSDLREMDIQTRLRAEGASFLNEKQLAAMRSHAEQVLQQKRALRQSARVSTESHSSSSARTEFQGC